MNSKDSDLSQSTVEDIGSYIAQITTTIINQLSALRTDGYIVTLGVKGATSTPYLTVTYAPEPKTYNSKTLLTTLETLQIRGWDLSRLNPTSKESLLPFFGKLVGRSSQEVEDILQEYSSRTSTQPEVECSSFSYGTQRGVREDSHSPRVANQLRTVWNAYQNANGTYWSQRGVGTVSYSDGQACQPSQCRVRVREVSFDDFANTVATMGSC